MMRSLFSGVSGLRNQQIKMDVIGNNIANVNTIGFKGSKVNFLEEVGQVLARGGTSVAGGSFNAVQVGLGVKTGSVDRQYSQGILQTTGNVTDLGLQGNGFFVVGDSDRQFFTRAGNFHYDSQGRLMTTTGLFVKGWMADPTGELSKSSTLTEIVVDPSLVSPAKATTKISLAGNLDASAVPVQEVWTAGKVLTVAASGNPAVGTTDLNALTQTTTPLVAGDTITITGTNPDGSAVSGTFTYGASNDGTTVDDFLAVINSAYSGATATLDSGKIVLTDDNFGASDLTIVLANGASNTGVISLPSFVNSAEGFTPKTTASTVIYDSLGTPHTANIEFTKTENEREWRFTVTLSGSETVLEGGSGTLTFKPDGSIETIAYDGAESAFKFDPNNGANPVAINLDFGNASGVNGLTQFDGSSNVIIPTQDGQPHGALSSLSIDESGRIIGSFTNGNNRLIAQIALAKFNNPGGLVHLGNNIFEKTEGSGSPLIGKAGEDISTAVISGSLESSNVDLAEEFSEMIIAQRAFQANARTITVSDQFLNEVVQLKR
ncbi:MAG: flagellar hook-basal body complex protein [bacterium]